LVTQYLDRIVVDDAQVLEPGRGGLSQEVAYPRPVDLDAEEVPRRLGRCAGGDVLAVAEADLERAGRLAPEHGREVDRRCGVRLSKARPQLIERASLRIGQAAGAQDVGAHRAPLQD